MTLVLRRIVYEKRFEKSREFDTRFSGAFVRRCQLFYGKTKCAPQPKINKIQWLKTENGQKVLKKRQK